MRIALEKSADKAFGIEDNILVWLCRHAGWLITRFHVQTDGLTPYQRLKGKPYSGELAEFGEQVYVKDPVTRQAKLEDRWIGPVTWIGKAERGDQHMTVSADGRAVELYRSVRRLPPSQRWKAEAMAKIKATPWQPKVTEPGEVKPRRRYITWAMLSQHGFSPNCRNCAGDGGAHSESCRLRFEAIWDREEARERRALAGELGRSSGGDGAAAGSASTPARQHPASAPETTTAAAPAAQSSAPDAPMDSAAPAAEPGRDLDVHMAETSRPKRQRPPEDGDMTAVLAQPASERTYEIGGFLVHADRADNN